MVVTSAFDDREPYSRAGPPSRRRVLIVDNSADLARALAGIIELEDDLESVGYVCTGAEALGLTRGQGADVVVLDLGLADCSGFTVLDRLRRERPAVKVIIYTGHASAELDHEAKSRGAAACVQKGGDLGLLFAAIRTP